MDTVKINSKGVKIIAHRGLSGLERENTAAAFVAAGNRSYYGIETDIHKTNDGKFIIIHDDTTGRVATENLNVEETDFYTLRSLILTDRDDKTIRADLILPTLEEYISICKKYKKLAVLEIKNRMSIEEIKTIYNNIKKQNYLGKTIFISFLLDNLIDLRKISKHQAAQYLVGEIIDIEKTILTLKKYNLGIDAYHKALTKENISKLHKNKIKVNAWTVNNVIDAKRLISIGVDFITTNILE